MLIVGATLLALVFCAMCVFSLPPLEPLPGVGNDVSVTAPLAALPTDRPARIAFVGDANNLRVYNLPQYLRAAAAWEPDVIVIGGDMVHGEASPARMRLALDEVRRAAVDIPILVVTGNHDVNPAPESFLAAFRGRELRFPLRGIEVALVDLYTAHPSVRPEGDHTVVFAHEPAWEANGPARFPLTDIEEPPMLYLCGHKHYHRVEEVRGTTQITAGEAPFLVLIEAAPEGATWTTQDVTPANPFRRRVVHFGVRAADDILRLKPKALLWLVPFMLAAFIRMRFGRPEATGILLSN